MPAKKSKSKPQPKSKAARDKLGLLAGSKRSEAAMLFARNNGATMAEVVEKTGLPFTQPTWLPPIILMRGHTACAMTPRHNHLQHVRGPW